MLCSIPKTAVITKQVRGLVNAPGEPNHGKAADLRWYTYAIPSGVTHYVELYIDGKRVLRHSATGRNIAPWRKAYEDMESLISVA